MEIKKYACKVLRFFNLVDRSCNLSITNIAVIVLITKMAITTFDWPSAAGLMVALLNYGHKRNESNKAEAKANEVAALAAVEAAKPVVSIEQLNAVKAQYEALAAQHEQVAKVAEEAKKFMSQNNLARGFQAPNRKPNG